MDNTIQIDGDTAKALAVTTINAFSSTVYWSSQDAGTFYVWEEGDGEVRLIPLDKIRYAQITKIYTYILYMQEEAKKLKLM